MKIALIGGTGFVGSVVLAELLQRGHQVSALARHPDRYAAHPALTVVEADALDSARVAAALEGHDALVSAYNPGWQDPHIRAHFLQGSDAIVAASRATPGLRLLMVGGAGSLYVAPGVQLVDTEGFPAAYREGALAAREALERLRRERTLDWTFVSPPALLAPGPRSGRYRLGGDELLMQGSEPAGISVADLAVAIVDELETPRHRQRRFTVASTA